ncbi:DUF1524 domain-containing protein [Georgenia sp. EYE_87]|uniref:GmrSD restriction endonuclease domain-containing protein n=1 Tax=Georgenia sp. EYE_87 TaxID=2853448 RepID=UPI002004212C|nr:DUF1524 domain-containing protein [Georgenia sp. EYE_87]MCK6212268.1 DUF1524 domain-containing protein [Georgenia sp. EYE_87]
MFQNAGPRRRPRWRTPLIVAAAVAVLGGVAGAFDDVEPSAPGTPVAVGTAAPTTTAEPAPTAAPSPTPSPTPTAVPSPTAEAAPSPSPAPGPPAGARPGTALAAVAGLEVKGRAPKTGYDREAFAYRAYDQDRNGCDVRNDILRRDLVDLAIGAGTSGCVVESGTLHDPYSGSAIAFVRGAATSGDVQIDHVVALSDAWQKGAQAWDASTLREFGNDPLNLLAVDGPLNSQKGDGDTATWLPPNQAYRCEYVARQVAVKAEYRLWVTGAERDAMVRVLTRCPDQPLPARETAPLMPEVAAAPAPSPEPAPASAPAPGGGGAGTDPRFSSCAKALDAGYGPYVSGVDAEYDWYRDGDSDGTVCES